MSPCTIATYRDTFRLFFVFTEHHLGRRPAELSLGDIGATLVLAFLCDLEKTRKNSARTRNNRLAAIRSFIHYVSMKEPIALAACEQILAIPMKRFEKPMIGFLSREQIEAILGAPDSETWSGRRDRVLFATLYNTGARVSELTGVRVSDLVLKPTASISILGKGRKHRTVPLWKQTALQLRQWLEFSPIGADQPLFPNRMGGRLSRTSVSDRLQLATDQASKSCKSLIGKRVSPHLVRHSTAMHLLQSGVDITVIALWLGHESPATTHGYIEADMAMKEKALNSIAMPETVISRFSPNDELMRFLDQL